MSTGSNAAGSKTDPPPAKAKPISGGGSKGEKLLHDRNYSWREHVRETTIQTPRSEKREREEVLQVLQQRFPCNSW